MKTIYYKWILGADYLVKHIEGDNNWYFIPKAAHEKRVGDYDGKWALVKGHIMPNNFLEEISEDEAFIECL